MSRFPGVNSTRQTEKFPRDARTCKHCRTNTETGQHSSPRNSHISTLRWRSRRRTSSLSWRTVRLCTACSLTCCAWCAGLTSFLARRRPAQVISLSVDTSVLLLFCYGLWVAIPPKLLEQRSTLLLTCSHRCVGRVPRGQWARLDSDTLVLIDKSACLVEPCASSAPLSS